MIRKAFLKPKNEFSQKKRSSAFPLRQVQEALFILVTCLLRIRRIQIIFTVYFAEEKCDVGSVAALT